MLILLTGRLLIFEFIIRLPVFPMLLFMLVFIFPELIFEFMFDVL